MQGKRPRFPGVCAAAEQVRRVNMPALKAPSPRGVLF
jgi:hypothetical protein